MVDFLAAKKTKKKKKSKTICKFGKLSYLCKRKSGASVAEQVDALDSKSSGIKPVPVRFRPDVRNGSETEVSLLFYSLSID